MNLLNEVDGLVRKSETNMPRRLVRGLKWVSPLDLYRFLFEEGPTVNLVIDSDGLIKDVNISWLEELGYVKEEVLGRPILEFVVPEERSKVRAQLERRFKGEPTPQLEVNVYAKDGSTRTILFKPGQLLLKKKDQPIALLVVGVDITERKRLEDELRSARDELQQIYDNLQDNVTLLDSSFHVLKVNRPDEVIFGLKRKEMVGRRCFEVLGELGAKGPCQGCPVEKALKTGQPARSTRLRRDGRFMELIAVPIVDPDGRVSRVVEIGRDLTEFKKAEERLREYSQELERMVEERTRQLQDSYRFLETVLDSIPDPVFIKDRSFKYVMTNQADRSLMGLSKEEVVGKTDYDRYPKEEADFFRKVDSEVVEKGVPVEVPEEKVTGKDGVTRVLHVKKAPIKDEEGRVAYIVGVARDITDLKRMEKELERSREEVRRLNEGLALRLMRNSRVLTEVSKLRDELRTVADVSTGLKKILESALSSLNMEVGAVLMLDPAGRVVRPRGFQSRFEGFKLKGEYPLEGGYVELEALKRRGPLNRILRPGEPSILGARGVLCAPIYVGGEPLGLLALGSRSEQILEEGDLPIFEAYCELVSVLLESERLRVTPTLEQAAVEAVERRFRLEPGFAYLILGDVDKAYEVFADQVRGGLPGLCVTRLYPPRVRRRYGMERTPIVWLNEEKVEDEQTIFSLQDLSIMISQFLESAEKAVIFIDGFEYLIVNHGFEPFIHFLQLQRSRIERTGSILIAPLIPEALEPKEAKLIEREMTTLKI